MDNTKRSICDFLEELISTGVSLSESIERDLTHGLSVANLYHGDLFDVLQSEFQTMDSILILVKNQKFKESFVIIRTLLELLLYFWLMIEGKLYRQITTYTVQPLDGLTAEERTKEIVQKWKDKKKQGDVGYQQIIDIQELPKKPNMFRVVYQFEGLFDEKDKTRSGDFIPFYYFMLTDHYSPSILNEQKESISAADYLYESKSEHIAIQKQFYYSYMRFESILDNLELNNLIIKNQKEYLEIHYNFLSQFVHPTKEAVWRFGNRLSHKTWPNIPDDVVSEQILLYVARIQFNFLKIITDKFRKENPLALLQTYFRFMSELNLASSHFWFFDNNPTSYDIRNSDIRKDAYRHLEKKEPPDIIIYYEDPILRLNELKHSNQI
ncbi:hypothetical protein [Candidatus Nitrosotenuis cloacae]|uniref:hypothetical protein n=1 Tax=Candidatus Nitrosotenuis cloacae TaxID=1603555 RepID=UPI0022810466|nr:hypothetical protein [Candidatus Nitrosotenuis cloacae]